MVPGAIKGIPASEAVPRPPNKVGSGWSDWASYLFQHCAIKPMRCGEKVRVYIFGSVEPIGEACLFHGIGITLDLERAKDLRRLLDDAISAADSLAESDGGKSS